MTPKCEYHAKSVSGQVCSGHAEERPKRGGCPVGSDSFRRRSVIVRRGTSIVLVVAAIVLITFGLIFLMGSQGKGTTILTGLVLLAAGIVLVSLAVNRLRRLAELDPDQLATDTVELAKRLSGEVTVAQVQAEFDVPGRLAAQVLEKLRGEGACHVEQREERTVFVFKSLMPSRAVKRCPYCGAGFSIRDAKRQCPNCGAMLAIGKE